MRVASSISGRFSNARWNRHGRLARPKHRTGARLEWRTANQVVANSNQFSRDQFPTTSYIFPHHRWSLIYASTLFPRLLANTNSTFGWKKEKRWIKLYLILSRFFSVIIFPYFTNILSKIDRHFLCAILKRTMEKDGNAGGLCTVESPSALRRIRLSR